MKKMLQLLSIALFFTSCEKKVSLIDDKKSEISIIFTNKIRSEGESYFGIFEISNSGNKSEEIGIVLDSDPAFCGYPVYEKMVNQEWIKVPVMYEGAVIFSTIHSGQKAKFEASLNKVKHYNDTNLRLLIAGTAGNHFHSEPFRLPVK